METPTQRRLGAIAFCAAVLCAGMARGQFLEFAGAEWRGRIDQPTADNMWTVGDTNGNGIIDEGETFGTRVNIGDSLLEEPATSFVVLPPVLVQSPINLMFGFIDVVDEVGGAFQPDGFDMEDPGREPDIIFGPFVDFDDIVFLPPSISSIGSDAYARYGGTQLMHVLRFESAPEYTLTTAHESLEIGYGARYLSSWQDYRITGRGGTLGTLFIGSSLDSNLLGPQASVRWTVREGRWRVHAEAAAAMTYMEMDGRQFAKVGEDAIPGQLNRPLYMAPARTDRTLNEWDIAPVLEAGLLASYEITAASRCFVRCDAIQFGNVRAIENTTVYQLPSFGFRDPGGSDESITSASVGFELRR
jgi:hypothetical protein